MSLTPLICVCTLTPRMGRPPKPEHLRRSTPLHIRLTPGERARLERASRELGVTVAEIFREGATLYLEQRGKGGSRKRKETKR